MGHHYWPSRVLRISLTSIQKTYQASLELLKENQTLDNQEAEIQALKSKLTEEQDKIIALKNYSRRENLRFMNIPECKDENCSEIIYYVIESEMSISTDCIQFHWLHRVGKPLLRDDFVDATPWSIIACFLCREDGDTM